jgi:hypothetical protein
MPHIAVQVITQGALLVAFALALVVNPQIKIRPNLFLGLYSILAVLTLMMSVRLVSKGTDYRAVRLILFLAVLWLLTPWFGRADLLILRSHRRVLLAVLFTLLLGMLLSPNRSLPPNRLSDVIWPIPPPQVAHYMAVLLGLTVLMWMSGLLAGRVTLLVVVLSVIALILTHTRTAVVGAVLGLMLASFSLFTTNRRVRIACAVVAAMGVFAFVGPSAVVTNWLQRGQSSSQLHDLSGRTDSWKLVLSNPRAETNKIFGSGQSNDSVSYQTNPALNGLPIDSSWIATYQNQGLVGDLIDGAILLSLLLTILFRPRGPTKAFALFLLVYCLVASYTESGLGEASVYLLDLAVAASLVSFRAEGTPDLDLASARGH